MVKGYYKKDLFGVLIEKVNGVTKTQIVIDVTGDLLYTNQGTDHRYVIKETEKVLNSYCC